MPIQEQNIVFVESQVLDDVPEGGGAATGRVVADGVLNNVFEDISDLDRAYGRFNLRKLFLAVRSLDTDLYGGAKLAITALPADPALGYALFTTSNPFDVRANAADRVASYLYKGPMWHGALHENHIAGMRAISILQRPGSRLPPIGKTLCLTQNEGLGNQTEQYVRIIKTEGVISTFADNNGDFEVLVIRCTLSAPLQFSFTGHVPNRIFSYSYSGAVRIRDTTVADVTNYYSSRPLKLAAQTTDREVVVDSVYTRLVPAARSEAILADSLAAGLVTQTVQSGTESFQLVGPAHTLAIPITAQNRAYSYVASCLPIPAPGALAVQWCVLGNWYSAIIDSTGKLTGEVTGSLSFTTGTLQMTFSALPDTESAIILTWATPLHFTDNAGATAQLDGIVIRGDFETMVARDSVVFTWLSGGVEKTATTSTTGVIAGHAKGFVAPTGKWWLDVSGNVPDADAEIQVSYDPAPVHTETLAITPSADGTLVAVLQGQPFPGSIEASWIVKHGTAEAVNTVTKIMGTKDLQDCKQVPVASDPAAPVNPSAPITPTLPSAYKIAVSIPAYANGSPWVNSQSGSAYLEIEVNASYPTAAQAKTVATNHLSNLRAVLGGQDQGQSILISDLPATVKAVHLSGVTPSAYLAARDATLTANRNLSFTIRPA